MRESLSDAGASAISKSEVHFQENLGEQERRIFFRDLCLLMWPKPKTDMGLAGAAHISDRMARYLLRLDHGPSSAVCEAVLDAARKRLR